jgi:hypothetical protein
MRMRTRLREYRIVPECVDVVRTVVLVLDLASLESRFTTLRLNWLTALRCLLILLSRVKIVPAQRLAFASSHS